MFQHFKKHQKRRQKYSILRLFHSGDFLLPALALLLSTGAAAQTFTQQTSTDNPFHFFVNPFEGVDIGDDASPAFVDIDNDGDLDAFCGEYNDNIHFFQNTGTNISPNFVEVVGPNNPLNSANGKGGYRYTVSFVDIDGDGDQDAFVGNDGNADISYYKNFGNANFPFFVQQIGANNPFDGETYTEPFPAFVDIDNDGDQDVFVGAYNGEMKYYLNTGNSMNPVFTRQPAAASPLNGVGSAYFETKPAFVDLDNDGDQDAIICTFGSILYYLNTGTPANAVFTEQLLGNNPFYYPQMERALVPAFADTDNDGDLDLMVGDKDGHIIFYKNTGNVAASNFLRYRADVNANSSPAFVDIDGDGDQDMFCGNYNSPNGPYGYIYYFENTGTNASPAYLPRYGTDNPLEGQEFIGRSYPSFVDIDNDGDMDAFIGDNTGTFFYYKNTGNAANPVFVEQMGAANPLDGFDVSADSSPAFADMDNDGDFDLFSGNLFGTFLYYKNTGTAANPVFVQQMGAANPLDGVDIGIASKIALADLDNDSDLDAMLGNVDGFFFYYKNTGTNAAPVFTEQLGADNPLDGVQIELLAAPAFVDVDNDNDPDFFTGGLSGNLFYFKNTTLLPVELAGFNATKKQGEAMLYWQTASEKNNEGFEIQYSINGKNWRRIGFVNGSGDYFGTKDYEYIHQNPQPGINYYRLKQLDFNGHFEYSKTVSLYFY
ncbi:MAG TPA: VCBS repeat-containing protein, partial [Bacteroidetes bacterium]|nr:VCBS repeat-containing protein [Bacteroidota bacterium]